MWTGSSGWSRRAGARSPGTRLSRQTRAFGAALRLWRGNALGDLGCEPFAQVETARLEEMRLGAIEDRIEADLALGRHADLISELEALVATHPLRERLHGQLMIALYRCGRQAEALEAYQAARRTLIEELGLEPGPALQRLERAILQQDPSLELPGRAVAGPAPGPAPGPGRASPAGAGPGRYQVRVIAVAVAAVVLAATLVVVGTAHRGQATLAGANGLVAVDTTSGRLVAAAPLKGAPEAVSGGARSVWVADPGGEAVTRIDPGSGAAVDRILVGGEPGSVVSGDGATWAASTDAAAVTRIDPATGSPRRTLSLDLQPSAIVVAGGAVWVAGYNDATVVKLAPVSGLVTGRVHVGNGPAALAFGDGSLWVANSLDATVSRVNPRTLAVRAPIPVGSGPDALVAGAGSVWAASQYSGTVSRMDPPRDQVVARVAVGGAPTSLAMGDGRLWVAVAANGASHRGGTFVIVTPVSLTSTLRTTLASVDPAFYNFAFNPQFTGLAYDSLVTFQQSPGAGGTRLVPDLALAIPAPADGGSTYAFRLRPGIRYSDGQMLRAGDFRRGIQRLFRVQSKGGVQSPGASLFSGILGATACARHPAGCDLSRGIVTDDAARTVVFHLTAPDPDFLFNLTQDAFAAPIPPGTPDHEITSHFVPGTGPYKIAAVSATRIRFTRNPFFREWSHAAQPAGNPDAIVWQTAPSVQDAVTAVEHGRADWMFGQIPRAQYQQLRLHSPSELHSSPQPGVDFAPLNTHIAPFNDVRVRRALNYAIDRRTLVRLFGGPVIATVTCQVITPGLPGYRRYCPYTRHPRADGAYTGPDLARARRLVAESGTAGERVDVWGMTDNPSVPRGITAYLGGVLRTLGYRVHLHLIPSATFTQKMRKRLQLSTDGDWAANYPDPASYVSQFFGCGGGYSNGYYCNPALDRQMRQARLLGLSHPARAAALWASIDHQITDDAVWVPTVNQREIDLVSNRLRNYENNPVRGLLVDQSWLR